MQRYLQIVTMGMVCVFGVGTANADVLSVYGAAKLDTVHGTGDVFEQFSSNTATGVEAGIEVLGIDLWGEALWMDNNQAYKNGVDHIRRFPCQYRWVWTNFVRNG